jgi:hypothetical protein
MSTSSEARPQARNWCFTENNYEGHITFDPEVMQYLIYSEEIGEEGTPHLQGYVQFINKKRLTAIKKMDTFHRASFRMAIGTVEQNQAYCSKSDTHISGPYEYGSAVHPGVARSYNDMVNAILDGTFTYETYAHQYMRYRNGADALLARVNKKRKRDEIQFSDTFDRPWQLDILRILLMPAHPRVVHWYYDPRGNAGKTTFARYLVKTFDADYFKTTKEERVMFAYNSAPVVVFDIARADSSQINYSSFETLKDGIGTSTMYQTITKIYQSPHVFVFANIPPDLSKLSGDRWHIVNIAPTLGEAQFHTLMDIVQPNPQE